MESPIVPILSVLLPFLLFAGIFAVVITFSQKMHKKLVANFQTLGNRLGLQTFTPEAKWYSASYPVTRGQLEGRRVEIGSRVSGSGKHQVHYTYVTVSLSNRSENTLQLTREGFLAKIGKKFGGQDIQINDPVFDDKYIIKSNSDSFARYFFNTDMKRLLSNAEPFFKGTLDVGGGEVRYEEVYQMNSEVYLNWTEDVVKMLLLIGERLDKL